MVFAVGDPDPLNVLKTLSFPGPKLCSSYDVECLAILHALRVLKQDEPLRELAGDVLICSDS